RLGRHYSRFSGFWPMAPVVDQSLALRKSQNRESNRRRRASHKWIASQTITEHDGGLWVATAEDRMAGTFGLERASQEAMELRSMYVTPTLRRQGIAGLMLVAAEAECHPRGFRRLELRTSELQPAALALYRNSGYALVREVVAEQISNKT